VYLCEADVTRIAEYLHLPQEDFEKRFVYRTKHQIRLRTPRNSTCHFLKPDGCSIHTVKPVQCRTFPFWPEILHDALTLTRTSHYCPGIGQGELVQIEEANTAAREMREAHPRFYRSFSE
jgi:Fe-S-cluster containining protein